MFTNLSPRIIPTQRGKTKIRLRREVVMKIVMLKKVMLTMRCVKAEPGGNAAAALKLIPLRQGRPPRVDLVMLIRLK